MASLTSKGFQISKNALFSLLTNKATRLVGKPAKLGFILNDAYHKLVDVKSTESGFAQIKGVMFTFIRLVRSYIQGHYRNVSTKSLVLGVTTLLYLIFPIDIIPDFIPILGYADDISLMAWFIKAFQEEIAKYKEWEHTQGIMPS